MNILVDLLLVVPGRNGGTETYIDGLLQEMKALPETNLICLTNKRNHSHYRHELGLSCHAASVDGRNRLSRLLYQQVATALVARRTNADVLFCPVYLAPILPTVPMVVVIHDANFHDIPDSMPLGVRLTHGLMMPLAARAAARIVTVSQFSKDRIRKALHVAEDKINMIHEGPLSVAEGVEACDWNQLKKKHGIRGDCLLSISSGLPHKNIARLVRGFIEMKKRRPGDQQLVLLGHQLDAEIETLAQRSGLREDILATGFVSAPEKLSFLRNSLLCCLPSLYEGFGLPALEAQSCGLPLAASQCASLPEVCGEGAAYFDALSVNSIANTLIDLYESPARREHLIGKGYENLRRFSWRKTALATRQVLGEAAQTRSATQGE